MSLLCCVLFGFLVKATKKKVTSNITRNIASYLSTPQPGSCCIAVGVADCCWYKSSFFIFAPECEPLHITASHLCEHQNIKKNSLISDNLWMVVMDADPKQSVMSCFSKTVRISGNELCLESHFPSSETITFHLPTHGCLCINIPRVLFAIVLWTKLPCET